MQSASGRAYNQRLQLINYMHTTNTCNKLHKCTSPTLANTSLQQSLHPAYPIGQWQGGPQGTRFFFH